MKFTRSGITAAASGFRVWDSFLRRVVPRYGKSSGYTIVEMMIFLAVSVTMLSGAMLLVSNQQDNAEFRHAYQEVESKLRDILNDINTGYYADLGDFKCTDSGSGELDITGVASDRGTNADCIFVGRAIQFGTDTRPNSLIIHTLVGRRLTTTAERKEATSLSDAAPITPLTTRTDIAGTSIPNLIESYDLPSILSIGWVRKSSATGGSPSRIVGLATSFRGFDLTGLQLESGSNSGVNIIPIETSDFAMTTAQAAGIIKDEVHSAPPDKLFICINNELNNQSLIMTIGNINQQNTANTEVRSTPC